MLSELLHQVLPHRPHAGSLAVNVHGDGEEEEGELDAAEGEKHRLGPIGVEPFVEEKGED